MSAVKVFVGNIPWTVGRNELRNCFSNFGLVSSVRLAFDKSTGFHRGYGFVLFAHPSSASAAMRERVELEGNLLEVRHDTSMQNGRQGS
ncbi:RNA binding protein-like [Tropilaelaps mercedesae]|uniref:RNA binding protein-like n=1 Tax=Tropilaelaps mercedesae TaxID=418985 RepID=A0A1V9X469_9ACAR|nr:RNA binding protein-like [Tropilaelaps mercedesae]